ncbi:MAG: DUF4845 domain-containing protein [Cellvibrionales bacterium]|nr:DUF4845 domain-containing protein [Cellvibrionales bacterium]
MRVQQGISTIGLLYLVGTLAIFGALAIKLGPEYIEYYQLRSIFSQVASEPGLRDKEIAEIRSMIRKRIDVSGIYGFDLKKDAFIGEDGDLLILEFQYSRKTQFVANIAMEVTFEYTKEIE